MTSGQIITFSTIAAALVVFLSGIYFAILALNGIIIPTYIPIISKNTTIQSSSIFILFSVSAVQWFAELFMMQEVNKIRSIYFEIESSFGTKIANEWLVEKVNNMSINDSSFVDIDPNVEIRLIDKFFEGK